MNTQSGTNQEQGRRRQATPQDPVGAADGLGDGYGQPQHEQVELAAYFLAEQRGFDPGHEMEDWIAAETEVARTESVGFPAGG